MQLHVVHWKERMNAGKVAAYGPVMDPAGAYGMGVVAAQDETELQAFINQDPASAMLRCSYFPMLAVVPSSPATLD